MDCVCLRVACSAAFKSCSQATSACLHLVLQDGFGAPGASMGCVANVLQCVSRLYLGMGCAFGQVVVDLGGVRDGLQALAHSCQGTRDEVGGAGVTHAKHHGGPHIKAIPLALIPASAAARDYVPAVQKAQGEAAV